MGDRSPARARSRPAGVARRSVRRARRRSRADRAGAAARPVGTRARSPRARRKCESRLRSAVEYAKQVTPLFEAGDDWRDVMPLADARELVGSVVGMLDRGEIRVAQVVDGA